jgi:DNA-binding NarL/FixJ family response regulator
VARPSTGLGRTQPLAAPLRDTLRERLRVIASRGVRKQEILECLAAGITDDQGIADHLKMAKNTVHQHFSELFDEVGIHDRVFVAVLWAELSRGTVSGETGQGEA